MTFSPKIVCVSILAALSAVMLPTNIAAQNAQVRHVSVADSGGVTEIKIETTKRVMPLTQVLTDPDRLVIDFPDALPVPELHGVAVRQGEVKGVRTSLLSAKPPMTRVVIDLKSAQEFRLVPTSTSVTIKFLGASTQSTPTEVANEATPPAEAAHPAEQNAPPAPSAPAQTAPQPATQLASTQPAEASEPIREAASATPVAVPAPEPPRPQLTVRATQQQMASAETPTPKASLVTTAKRPMITIERTAAAPARATLTTATVVKPAIEAVAPAPAPVPPPSAPASGTAQIRRVAVLKSGGAMEIEIETSQRVVPATQLITGPDRLVLDFAGSLPGPQLRAMSVNQGQVKGVRAALLSANPPVTRVVLDLKSPQEFQLFPSTKSVVVKLPGSLAPASAPTAPATASNDASTEVAAAPLPEAPKVTVTFQDGKLRLSSDRGSLADVLNEVRAQTGAEIAIPAGAEQEKVVATIGPTNPRDALSQLLNGSRYNFIIVGTDADPNQLERVVLTPKANFDANEVAPQEPQAPAPVAAMAPPPRSVRSVRRNVLNTPPPVLNTPPPPPPTEVPPTDDAQPQGDSNPPPDTTPQPGDPQAPPQ
jgi:hypothetical protein